MAFDRDIGRWDTSKVVDFKNMFYLNPTFNQPIGSWEISAHAGEISMGGMFHRATSFNQNIATWNVSKVTIMNKMFFDATSFNQDLSSWKSAPGVERECTDFAAGSDCPEVDATKTCSLPDYDVCAA